MCRLQGMSPGLPQGRDGAQEHEIFERDGVLRIASSLISDRAALDEIVARLSELLATPPGIYGRAVASVA